MLLVRGEEGEVLQDVQHHAGPHQALHRGPHVAHFAFVLIVVITPRSPEVDGHADAAVAQQPSFGGKGEHIRHKHGRDLLFVDLVHLIRPVEPRHRAARRCLRLADHQRQTVHQKDHVEALHHTARLVGPLVRHRKPVPSRLREIHQPHRHMLAVRAKGHRLFPAQPGHEVLVRPHQPVALHGEQDGSQRIDHLVRPVLLFRDLGIQGNERLPHPRLHHHLTQLTRQRRRRHVDPARRLELLAQRTAPARRRVLAHHGTARAAAEAGRSVEDHLLDGVGFGEAHSRSWKMMLIKLVNSAVWVSMCFLPLVWDSIRLRK